MASQSKSKYSKEFIDELATLPGREVLNAKQIKKLLGDLSIDDEERKVISSYYITPTSGWEAIQGRRWDLQDSIVSLDNVLHYRPDLADLPDALSFYAVFDGHGGREVSDILETLFLDTLLGPDCLPLLYARDYEAALRESFRRCGGLIEEFCAATKCRSGSCATVVLIAGRQLVVANIGDSEVYLGRRALLMSTNYNDLILTQKHAPHFPPEQRAVEAAGGKVVDKRVEGKLAISRAFGDISLRACGRSDGKNLIHHEPFVRTYELCARDDFILLACDGLFDVLKPKHINDSVRRGLAKGHTPTTVAESLIKSVMNLSSSDNVSALLVYLYKSKTKPVFPSSYQKKKSS